MDVCEYAKKLWRLYILADDQASFNKLFNVMNEKISIIGTGRHEFYEKLSDFAKALENETPEREAIEFAINSVSVKEQPVTEYVKLAYGRLHVIGKGKHTNISVDMDTRFTLVFQRIEGNWKVIHVHQSLPYIDQQEGEYYPKTLLDQLEEANQRAEYMELLATMDQMTGLLNHSAFYEESNKQMEKYGGGFCMTIDLDDFKQTNDSYGHQAGDAVLQEMGRIIRAVAKDHCVVGRIGGDEFALFSGKITSGEDACAMAKEIMSRADGFVGEDKTPFPGISIGISLVRKQEKLKDAFRRADKMLYEAKRSGKRGFRFCE